MVLVEKTPFPSYCRSAPSGANHRDTHGWQQTNSAGISRVICSGILLLLLATHLMAQAQTQFEWRDASGNVRSLSDLQKILREHHQWGESEKKAGTRANLDANLTDANLDHADLGRANLNGAFLVKAVLDHANLTDARLIGANLTGAWLGKANLSRALLANADLRGAILKEANLTGAFPVSANLSRAILMAANLSDANLSDANLTDAAILNTNFDRAIFEPNSRNFASTEFGIAHLLPESGSLGSAPHTI